MFAEGDVKHNHPLRRHYFPYVVCGAATLINANYGYDMGGIATVSFLLQEQTEFVITEKEIEVYVAMLFISCVIGGFLSNFIADLLGRWKAMLIAEVVFLVGIVGTAVSYSYASLLIFRFISGIGFGLGFLLPSLYIGEIAPTYIRGLLSSRSALAVEFGLLGAFIAAWAFSALSPATHWRAVVALEAILPISLLAALYFMPESPRWLLVNGCEAEARAVFENIREPGEYIDAMIESIKTSIEKDSGSEGNGWEDILYSKEPNLRFMIIIGVGIAIAQVLGFGEILTLYSVYILRDVAGVTNQHKYAILMLLALGRVATVWIANNLFDHPDFGRRIMMITSGCGVTISLLVLGILATFTINEALEHALIGLLFLFMISFSIGYGPGSWLILSEISPLHVRAKAQSLATMINRIVLAIFVGTFFTIVTSTSYAALFLIYFSCSFVALVFIVTIVAETRDIALENIGTLFGSNEETRVLL